MDFKNNNIGSLVISEEVVSQIAATAAKDINGVADVVPKAQGIKSAIKSKQVVRPVHVALKDSQILLDIYVKLQEGTRVVETAQKIQEAVKEAVQNMTGNVVSKVNVHICEVELNKTEE